MLYILALHIIFVVTWFAGLFYTVRLFVYHSEALRKAEPDRTILIKHFKKAEKRLWYGITWPSAIGTWAMGIMLVVMMYGWNIPGWLVVKWLFVILLSTYHLVCGRMLKSYLNDRARFSSMQMRIWNEVATVFLFTIVFIVILKDKIEWIYGVAGIILFALALFAGIRIYRKIRERKV